MTILDCRGRQNIIFMEGPDGCGKTNIGQFLSAEWDIPYFRFSRQHEMWDKNQFVLALEYDQPYLASFLKQVGCNVIIDRGYASERCYSRVFGRSTNDKIIEEVDKKFSELGAVFFVLLRRDYSKNGEDIVVPNAMLPKLHDAYMNFVDWTTCSCIVMHVDDFRNDVNEQEPVLFNAYELILSSKEKKIIVL